MPELPEVETIRRGLLPVVYGQIVRDMQIRRRDLRWPIPMGVEQTVSGAETLSLNRRGKYLLWRLSGGWTQILHLGMSGRVLILENAMAPTPHDHIDWLLEDGRCIRFHDPRRFGSLDFARDNAVFNHPRLSAMGPEPDDMTLEAFHSGLFGRRSRLASRLLDQQFIAGLGNIYVNEACFRAGLSPLMAAGDVSKDACKKLLNEIQLVLKDAITAGGSSLRDYVQADGSLGYFSSQWQVYGREGEACSQCSKTIIRLTLGGRSLFLCPNCQNQDCQSSTC